MGVVGYKLIFVTIQKKKWGQKWQERQEIHITVYMFVYLWINRLVWMDPVALIALLTSEDQDWGGENDEFYTSAGPWITLFYSVLFCCDIDEMPLGLNSYSYQLAYGKIGFFIRCFTYKLQDQWMMLSEDLLWYLRLWHMYWVGHKCLVRNTMYIILTRNTFYRWRNRGTKKVNHSGSSWQRQYSNWDLILKSLPFTPARPCPELYSGSALRP